MGLFIALQVGTKGECAFLKLWGVIQVRNWVQKHRSPPFLRSLPVYNNQGWLAAMRISHTRLKDPPHQQSLFTCELTKGFLEPPGIYLPASFPTHTRPLLSYSNTSTLTLGALFPSFNHLKFSSCIYSLHILGQMPPCTSSTPQIPVTNKIKPFQVSLPLLPFLWSS